MTFNINAKLVILAVILIAFFVGLVLMIQASERERVEEFFRSQESARAFIIDNVMELLGSSLQTFVYDYTYWDEMVAFTETQDRAWASENIVSSLGTYNVDGVWIFSAGKELIFSVNDLDDAFFEMPPLDGPAIDFVFAVNRTCRFFMNTPVGIMEIRGSTIHPSSDPERKTEPKGYFLAGRLWDKGFFDNISKMTETETRLVPVSFNDAGRRLIDIKNGMMTFPMILSDWKGQPVITLEMVYVSKSIMTFNRTSSMLFLALYAYLVFTVLTVGLLTVVWLSRPLGAIADSLEYENPIYLERVSAKNDEFGRIARLVINFFKQRELLSYEAAVRKKSEDALEASERKFSAAFYTVPVPLILSLFETGLIVDANDAFGRLFGFSREELLNNRSTDLGILSEKDRETLKRTLKLGTRDNVFRGEIVMRARGGNERLCDVMSKIVKLDVGDCIISSIVDITETRKNENELRRRMDEIEQFSRIAVGRELKMMELKSRISELRERLGEKEGQ